jgi:hypothetical protein
MRSVQKLLFSALVKLPNLLLSVLLAATRNQQILRQIADVHKLPVQSALLNEAWQTRIVRGVPLLLGVLRRTPRSIE